MSDPAPPVPRPFGPFFAHLDATVAITPVEVGPDFWTRTVGELPSGRLLSTFATTADWDSWEMHPAGDELILQLTGAMELVLDAGNGVEQRLRLDAGHFVVVPPGTWHTADVIEPGEALYLTFGDGTEHRPRS